MVDAAITCGRNGFFMMSRFGGQWNNNEQRALLGVPTL